MQTNQTPEALAEEIKRLANEARDGFSRFEFEEKRYREGNGHWSLRLEALNHTHATIDSLEFCASRLRDMTASGAGLSDEAPSSQWPQRARVLVAEMFMALEKAKRVMDRDCAISIPEVEAAIERYAAEVRGDAA
jgi:hypothetical protein